MTLSHTQDALDAMHANILRQRKNSKAWHEARANYFEAVCQNARDERDDLKASIAGSDLGKVCDERESLAKDVANLKAQIDDYDKDTQDTVLVANQERDEAQAELWALREALGLTALEWDRAKSIGRLPTGQFLTLD